MPGYGDVYWQQKMIIELNLSSGEKLKARPYSNKFHEQLDQGSVFTDPSVKGPYTEQPSEDTGNTTNLWVIESLVNVAQFFINPILREINPMFITNIVEDTNYNPLLDLISMMSATYSLLVKRTENMIESFAEDIGSVIKSMLLDPDWAQDAVQALLDIGDYIKITKRLSVKP